MGGFYLAWYNLFAFLFFGSQWWKSLTNFIYFHFYLKRSLVWKSLHIENALLCGLCFCALYFLKNFWYGGLKGFFVNKTLVLCFLAGRFKFLLYLHFVRLNYLWCCQRFSFLFFRLLYWGNLCRPQFLNTTWHYLCNHLFFCLHCCFNRLNNAHSKFLPILPCHLKWLLTRPIQSQRILASKRQNILLHLEIHPGRFNLFSLCLELAWRHLKILWLVP